jgi:D-arabinose 1-dehydrogenase-like Zn-dependent alcohol dehydrogenase
VCDTPLVPGVAYWGGYGRRVAVPYADVNLVALPESVGFVDAASMGCRYMTSFHAVVDQAQVQGGEWVAVHGCGGVGLSAVQIATALGASVIAVDVSDEKLAFAKELGAVATVNAAKDEPAGAIAGMTQGGAHVSIDALGVAATCRNSVMSLRKRGRHLQIGLTSAAEKGEVALPIDLIVLKELSIIGSLGMQAPRFPAMLRMVEAGKLKPGKLVHRTIPLEEAGGVLASMDKYGTVGVTVINKY